MRKYFRYNNIFLHIIYWVLNVLFFTVLFSSNDNFYQFLKTLAINALFLPGALIFTYFSIEYLFSRYLFSGKILKYLIFQTVVFAAYPLFSELLRGLFIEMITGEPASDYSAFDHLITMMILIAGMAPVGFFKIATKQSSDQLLKTNAEKAQLKAEIKLREAELKILKAQIHPHFLFNTLNNLYSLALEKSEKTPEVIIMLSNMLSYVTYECSHEKVPLQHEIDFIKNYIDLEKLRYDDNLDLNVEVEGDFDGKLVPPMIFHTFIENSFKHGTSNNGEKSWIKINISCKGQYLRFSVSNSKDENNNSRDQGIGIENAKKRLNLIYPDKHQLSITDLGGYYTSSLNIVL